MTKSVIANKLEFYESKSFNSLIVLIVKTGLKLWTKHLENTLLKLWNIRNTLNYKFEHK